MNDTELDVRLELVADRHRRCILQYLRGKSGEVVPIAELGDAVKRMIADEECDSSLDHDRLVVHLSHVHLPKFAEHDVIEYDRDSNTVRYESSEQIETLLDVCVEEARSLSL